MSEGHVRPVDGEVRRGLTGGWPALVGIGGRSDGPVAAVLIALLAVIGFTCAWPVFRWAYGLPGLGVSAPGRILSLA